MSDEKQTTPTDKPVEGLVYPYCGGCGHRFFHREKMSASKADEESKVRRCGYCLDEMRAGDEQVDYCGGE